MRYYPQHAQVCMGCALCTPQWLEKGFNILVGEYNQLDRFRRCAIAAWCCAPVQDGVVACGHKVSVAAMNPTFKPLWLAYAYCVKP